MAGIIGYGAHIPFTRIKVEEIHKAWRNINLDKLKNVLMAEERAVLEPNEDTITLAVAAAKEALAQSGVSKERIDAIFLGTCTNPYDSQALDDGRFRGYRNSAPFHRCRYPVFGKIGDHGYPALLELGAVRHGKGRPRDRV